MNEIEISIIGLPQDEREAAAQSIAQETGRHWQAILPRGATVGDLIRHLSLPEAEIEMVLVDGRQADVDTVLEDGSAVAFTGQICGD